MRAVGPWGLAASIVNTIVGAGIFAVPAALAASVGSYAPLAFVVCAAAVGCVAICFAEGGSRVPTSGGAYGYIKVAFGPLAGFVAGTLLWFGNVLSCGGVAAALGDVAASLAGRSAQPAVRALVIVAVVGVIAFVNIRGVARGLSFVNAATLAKLVPLLVFVAVGAVVAHAASPASRLAPATSGVGRALILATFAFAGMEAPLSASGEVKEPSRSIPRALAIAMAFVTVLYVSIQVIAQRLLGDALATSKAPLADAMGQSSAALRGLMLVGAALSMFGWIGSDLLGTPRMLFALSRDRWLPRFLGRVHPQTHAPHVAIASYAALAVALALSGTFAELAVLSTLASAAFYVGGCAAALRLSRRGVARAGAPLGFRALPLVAALGIASMLTMIALASRAEILGLLGLMGASAVVFAVQAGRRARAGDGGGPTLEP